MNKYFRSTNTNGNSQMMEPLPSTLLLRPLQRAPISQPMVLRDIIQAFRPLTKDGDD